MFYSQTCFLEPRYGLTAALTNQFSLPRLPHQTHTDWIQQQQQRIVSGYFPGFGTRSSNGDKAFDKETSFPMPAALLLSFNAFVLWLCPFCSLLMWWDLEKPDGDAATWRVTKAERRIIRSSRHHWDIKVAAGDTVGLSLRAAHTNASSLQTKE